MTKTVGEATRMVVVETMVVVEVMARAFPIEPARSVEGWSAVMRSSLVCLVHLVHFLVHLHLLR